MSKEFPKTIYATVEDPGTEDEFLLAHEAPSEISGADGIAIGVYTLTDRKTLKTIVE